MALGLDPAEDVAWAQVQEAAQLIKVLLEKLGLIRVVKTSGGKGLNVVLPIQHRDDWATVKGLSKAIVQHLADMIPKRLVAKKRPEKSMQIICVRADVKQPSVPRRPERVQKWASQCNCMERGIAR